MCKVVKKTKSYVYLVYVKISNTQKMYVIYSLYSLWPYLAAYDTLFYI